MITPLAPHPDYILISHRYYNPQSSPYTKWAGERKGSVFHQLLHLRPETNDTQKNFFSLRKPTVLSLRGMLWRVVPCPEKYVYYKVWPLSTDRKDVGWERHSHCFIIQRNSILYPYKENTIFVNFRIS